MPLLLSCVVDRDPGILPHGAELVGVWPGLVVQRVRTAPKATLESLRAHHELSVALARETAVLPFRFGETVADEEAAHAWLAEHGARILPALGRVRDRWEFDLKAPPAEETEAPAAAGEGPGTRYLRALADRYAGTSDEALAAIAAEAAAHVTAAETLIDPPGRQIAFLVPAEDAPLFTAAARSWTPAPGWRWSGPFPAYTFAAKWLAPS